MTINEFLEAYSLLNGRKWKRVVSWGGQVRLRRRVWGIFLRQYCPITAIAEEKFQTKFGQTQAYLAGKKLGLNLNDASDIIYASDHNIYSILMINDPKIINIRARLEESRL